MSLSVLCICVCVNFCACTVHSFYMYTSFLNLLHFLEKNMILMGVGEIVMPENFITMFKAPENPEVIISHGVETALLLAAEIKAGFRYR